VEALVDGAGETIAVIVLTGELDVADPDWADEIEAVLDSGGNRLVLDLTNVTFIDSSVVRTLVLTHRRVGEDGWLRLVYTHHLIARVIAICGLADAFPQYATVESALRAGAPRNEAGRRLREQARHSTRRSGDRDDDD
jgi:anti-anti-sigma factor